MLFARASAPRGAIRAPRSTRPVALRPQPFRQLARRGYASEGHGHKQASSDLPWAIGSVAFTVPACWYLLSSRPEVDHSTHEEHAEEHEEKEEEQEEPKEEEQPAQESKEESTDSEKSDDSDSDEQKDDTPVTTEDESERDDQNTKKVVPDAKGGNKKRLESNNGMKQGELDEEPEEGKDSAAASKQPGNRNTMSGKQEGLSNSDTKHSTDLTTNPEKSRKGEGSPETSKSKGTVAVDRPQPENQEQPKK